MKFKNKKKMMAVGLVVILVIVGLGALFIFDSDDDSSFEDGIVSLEMILATKSTRTPTNISAVVASYVSPFFPLVATPVSVYYGPERITVPLLVADISNPSRAVVDFLSYYGMPSITSFGPVDGLEDIGISIEEQFPDTDAIILSRKVANTYWSSSDGVILVHNSQEGYSAALSVVPIASYLNIPVIIADKMDDELAGFLKSFSLKYSLVCGPITGFGKVRHFNDPNSPVYTEQLVNITRKIIEDRIGESVKYITLANPDDTKPMVVLDSVSYSFEGEVSDSSAAAYPGAAPSTSAGDPIHYWDIPVDYRYANVKVDLKMDVSGENLGDAGGSRIYAYLGVDGDENGVIETSKEGDILQHFGGSPGYDNIGYSSSNDPFAKNRYAHYYTELPFFNRSMASNQKVILFKFILYIGP